MIRHEDELFRRRQENRSDMTAAVEQINGPMNAEARLQRMAFADRGESERRALGDDLNLDRQSEMRRKRTAEQMSRINVAFRKLKTVKHVPGKSALVSDYGSKFRSKYNDDVRASKQNNKRSRLFKKKEISKC